MKRVRVWCGVAAILMLAGLSVPGRGSAATPPAFGASVLLRCRALTGTNCSQNIEPDVKIDGEGNAYVSAITGVPGGVNLWKRTAGGTRFGFVGMPDELPAGLTRTTGLAPGGGDVSVAVAPVRNTSGRYNVYLASLSAASVTVSSSRDGGATFKKNYAATAPIGDVDRQWIAARGAETVYLMYRDGAKMLWVHRSDDGGKTFSPPHPMLTNPQAIAVAGTPVSTAARFSNLIVDRTGGIYLAFVTEATPVASVYANAVPGPAVSSLPPDRRPEQRRRLWLARCTFKLSCSDVVLFTAPDPQTRLDAVFPWITSDDAGNVYVVYSTTEGVFLLRLGRVGNVVSGPVRVDTPPGPAWRTVLPAVIAGSPGRVGVAFIASQTSSIDDATSTWNVYYAFSSAFGQAGTFTQVLASDQPNHVGSVCLRGLYCDVPVPGFEGDRSLAEVVTLAIDADGMPIIAYPASVRDGKTLGGTQSVLVKQMSGDRLIDGLIGTPSPIEPPPPVTFGPPVAQTLHFDSALPEGDPEQVRGFLAPDAGPILSHSAPSGAVKIVKTSALGNPAVAGNPFLAWFALAGPVKVTATPVVDVWLSMPGVESVTPLRLSVELFADGVPSLGHTGPSGFVPFTVDVAAGPAPARFHLILPAVDVIALDRLTLQLGVELPQTSSQPVAAVVYGSSRFDSILSVPVAAGS